MITPETRKAIERYITYHLDDPAMQEPTKGWLRECLDEIDRLSNTLDSDLDRLARWDRKFKENKAEIERLREANYKFVCADDLKQKLAEARALVEPLIKLLEWSEKEPLCIDRISQIIEIAHLRRAAQWMKDCEKSDD